MNARRHRPSTFAADPTGAENAEREAHGPMESEHSGAADRPPVALTVAGSDSGGGAGIQADLKTFQAFGVFGTSALTAVTAQNTRGVTDVQVIRPETVRAQVRAVAEDLAPAACKSGMLADEGVVRAVAASLEEAALPAYVLDPVVVAQSGDRLLEEAAVRSLRSELVPRADLVTPNLEEAALLAGLEEVSDEDDMRRAAESVRASGAGAVLVTGGHLREGRVVDLLLDDRGWRAWRGDRIETGNSHGTGCTLSAAVAAGLALGRELRAAVDVAVRYTRQAIRTAPDLGGGNGPLNHWAPVPDQ